ncbi:ATP-binding cassette transporter, subfamily C, member 15, SmABCC15 [Selaginella moellendorffii]|uniref:ATP-binding cassette transporter, subfamily C, member 15, SmABCC15 n=1 Tax=Selaginella moellendorffii TaxID=88036 RepID=D8RH21_SELML|nr:ATP-binding cassette transporter, subfamily C, member 15, SmABCC15 [Selaginella moellendorffii]
MDSSSLRESLIDENPARSGKGGYDHAGFLAKLTLSWLNPLLHLGSSRHLEAADIPALGHGDRADALLEELRSRGGDAEKIVEGGRKDIFVALLRCHRRLIFFTGLLALVRTLAISAGPIFLYLFVDSIARRDLNPSNGFLVILGLVAVKATQSIAHRHWSFQSRRLGVKARASVCAAVYDKILKISSKARQRHSGGEIVSYMGVDSYRLGEFSWWIHYSWACILQLLIAVLVLVKIAKLATLATLLVLLVTFFVQIPISRNLQLAQTNLMIAQDERLRRTAEVLNSVKIIKLQAWEEEFKKMIDACRERELRWTKSVHVGRSKSVMVFWLSYATALSLTLIAYVWLGYELNAAAIFTIFSAFANTQEPVRIIADVLTTVSQAIVSIKRLQIFFQDDETGDESTSVGTTCAAGMDSAVRIRIHGPATFAWDFDHSSPSSHCKKSLSSVNLSIRSGQKVAVCGAVGSGKSSLLCAMLGEIPKITGEVQVNGTVAYVSQVAWIQSGTIRDNILFGKTMVEESYSKVIRACALERDLEMFPLGDLTEIGERGLNLSGGQKQRIQLARAVYNDADIYLLDDPFSAVDAQTAATLFHECVMKSLRNKTVVLVTHQVEFLPALDVVVVMEGGTIEQLGSYEELLNTGLTLEKLVNAHHDTLSNALSKSSDDGGKRTGVTNTPADSNDESTNQTQTAQLTADEEKEFGDLGLQPYKDYLSISKGHVLFGFDLLMQVGLVAGQVTGGLWLAYQVMKPGIDGPYVAYGYTIIAYVTSLFLLVRLFVHLALGLKASRSIYSGLMTSLFRAPMSFFDSTPTGRILTRASSDMSIVDVDVFMVGHILIAFVFDFPGVMVVLGVVLWPSLFVVIPMLWVILKIEAFYRTSAQEMMRLNAMTKSPILNLSGETVRGAVTIRAFRMKERFMQRSMELINKDSSIYLHTNAAIEWLILRVEACGLILLLVFGVGLNLDPSLTPGLAGVGLAYGLLINVSLVFMSQWYCQMASHIVSVERIKQYMDIPVEPPAIVEHNRPPKTWPSHGEIVFQNLQIKYRPDLPLVLRGISCKMEGGKRIGVVGRTGSGKSTLISAIFRLVDPAGGTILIDGIDICSIGLHDLRSKLGIIPQEPTLFRGTIRTNLDPLGKYSDLDIWEALEKCQMAKEIHSMANQLDSSVSDEGGNWSAGQRQLFCLGRVLLKRTRVLVLDEATASIDSSTDAVLQRVIREEFATCTVVTVAHRIPTVIDCDMVLTLQDGVLLEFQPPEVLLQDRSSGFAKLVAEYWAQRSHRN